MAALQRSTTALRRVALGTAPRRGMAADHGPSVTWAEYRAGEKTLSEWVDGNRAKVSFGFFVFYCSLGAWAMRPKKGKAKSVTAELVDGTASSPDSAAPAA